MKVLCIGMMVCDHLISVVPDNILELDSVSINRPLLSCGGDALNVAVGLAKLKQDVSITGRIADDANGRFILSECKKYGVDVSGVLFEQDSGTAVSYALIDTAGERHFLSEKSIFEKLSGNDVKDEAIMQSDIVYIGSAMAMRLMDKEGIADIFTRAHQNNKITVLDAAINLEDEKRDWLKYLGPAFSHTDIFLPSIDEASEITGESEPERIASCFEQFPMKAFGIKLGARGCFITDFDKTGYIQPPQGLPVADTTGAGDSFVAGYICGLIKGWDTFKCAEFATAVAARNVGYIGGTAGIADFETTYRFYRTHKKG